MVAAAREEVERRDRTGFVDEGHMRHGHCHPGNHRNRRGAAARARTRAVVLPGPMICGRRVLRGPIVVRMARPHLPSNRVDPAMHRATHRPLGAAHEERKPEREREGQSPNGQRTVHGEDRGLIGLPEWRLGRAQYTRDSCATRWVIQPIEDERLRISSRPAPPLLPAARTPHLCRSGTTRRV